MRKFLLTFVTATALAATLAGAYIIYPLHTAWAIREAVRNGDSAYLERKIEWASVRETLRTSMHQVAFDMPDPDTEPGVKPTLWKRIKAYVGGGAVDRFVDSYVTPEGLPRLFEYRKFYRQTISNEPDEKTLPIGTRIGNFWKRLKRAEFRSLTEFEVELADKHEPTRHHVGLLELDGFEWKLTELRMIEAAAEKASLATAVLPTDR